MVLLNIGELLGGGVANELRTPRLKKCDEAVETVYDHVMLESWKHSSVVGVCLPRSRHSRNEIGNVATSRLSMQQTARIRQRMGES